MGHCDCHNEWDCGRRTGTDWRSVLTDVDYALRQLRVIAVGGVPPRMSQDRAQRALDALERIGETAHRNATGEG